MRVLLIGPRPPPAGGVAAHVSDLADALGRGGVQVTVCDPRRRAGGGDGRPALLARLALARARGEVVHAHLNGHNRKSWLVALAAASSGRAVLTVHSGLAPAFLRTSSRLARVACDRCRAVVAVNAQIAAALLGIGVSARRVHVRPAFCPTAILPLAPAGLRQLRRRSRPLLCCALAPGPEYGAASLLAAVALLRPRLPLMGVALFGPGTHDPTLAERVRHLGLAETVHLLGPLCRARARGVIASSDLFIRPTLADGDAVSVREALTLGRPVVASAVGFRPAGVHTYDGGSPAALAETIFRVLGTPAPVKPEPSDCLPLLLSLYRQAEGAGRGPVAPGTQLASGMRGGAEEDRTCAASPVESISGPRSIETSSSG